MEWGHSRPASIGQQCGQCNHETDVVHFVGEFGGLWKYICAVCALRALPRMARTLIHRADAAVREWRATGHQRAFTEAHLETPSAW